MNEIEYVILKLSEMDFSCLVEYDYDREVADDHYETCANDYCRCSTIVNFTITKIYTTKIIEHIKEYINFSSNVELLNDDISKIFNNLTDDDFDVNICNGYYGEELNTIKLQQHVVNKLANILCVKAYRKEKLNKINFYSKRDDNFDEYVKKILTEEYGYLLSSLENSNFTIIEVNTSDIVFPQIEYNEYVKSDNLTSYKNKKGVCGLVKKVDNKYYVIDGYHRINANLNNNKIKVILAYKK